MSEHSGSPHRPSNGGGRPRRDSRSDGGRPGRSGGGYQGRSGGSDRFSSEGRGGRGERRDDRRGDRRDDRRDGGRGGRPGNAGGFRSNRGGQDSREVRTGPQRSGYREERLNKRNAEPEVPADVSPKELDPDVRQELRSLAKDNADMVAKHMIMAATLLETEPEKALQHARAAKDRGGRVSITRETLGITAYHAGEWKEALAELRAARRMAGGPGMLAVMADCERGLGRPEKALEVANGPEAADLDPEGRAELAIVVAGALHDLGRNEDAVEAIEPETRAADLPEVTVLRVTYAYADALAIAGRTEDARKWFARADELDEEDVLDAGDRLKELS